MEFKKLYFRSKWAAKAFLKGFKHFATDEGIIIVSTAIGLSQGLKYSGNLERGIKTGVGTYMILNMVSGISTIVMNTDKIAYNADIDIIAYDLENEEITIIIED